MAELESTEFIFSQDGNSMKGSDNPEQIIIKVQHDLGVDRGDGCFYEIATDGWSFDSLDELQEMIDRIQKSITK